MKHEKRGVFVVGTDTGVGKTTLSRALLRLAASRGLTVAPMKPVESGVGPAGPSDALALRAASGSNLPLSDVCPYPLALPVAPVVAARAESVHLDLDAILARYRAFGSNMPVLVESAGGLLSPLTDHETNADLAAHLGLPVLLVARNGLGTINHTALALGELNRRGLPLAATILVSTAPEGPDGATNATCISTLCRVDILGPLPFLPGADDDTLASALAMLPQGAAERLIANFA